MPKSSIANFPKKYRIATARQTNEAIDRNILKNVMAEAPGPAEFESKAKSERNSVR
jgi:hypothetical protein